VKKIRNQCQTKNPILKAYRNEVWHLINNFFISFNMQFFPRDRNQMVESLAVDASDIKSPQTPCSDMKSRSGTNLQYQTMSSIGRRLKMRNKSNASWRLLDNF